MKYYFVSDLHGCHPSLLSSALEERGFNAGTDTLVVLGDIVDRGYYSIPLIKFVNSLPNVIRVWGNHDFRTREVVLGIGSKPDKYDKHNGVGATLHSICGFADPSNHFEPNSHKAESIWYYLHALMPGNPTARDNINALLEYTSKCVWAIEFDGLFATHAWVPHIVVNEFDRKYMALRRSLTNLSGLSQYDWVEASWANTVDCLKSHLFIDKPMLVGHWWAADVRARFEQHKTLEDAIQDGTVNFGPFELQPENARYPIFFLDPFVAMSSQVNVLIYESDEEPFVYTSKKSFENGQACADVVKMSIGESKINE